MFHEGSGPLVSVNIGFGYNRLQDLNYQYSYYTQGNVSSIADVFSDMLQYSGINRDQITGGFNWSNFNPRALGFDPSDTRPDLRIKSAAGGSRPGSATTSISATIRPS